jgi:hypothetical protein
MGKKNTAKSGAGGLVHLGWGRDGKALCGKDGKQTDYLKSVTCPECLLIQIEELNKARREVHAHARRAEEKVIAAEAAMKSAEGDLLNTKQRCERLTDLVDGITQRLADAVGREESARAALRAVAQLV